MSPLEAAIAGFALGIANFLHCAAMCGPFAARAGGGARGLGLVPRFGVFAGGKTFSYLMLGVAAGMLGKQAAAAGDLRAWLGVAAALLMIGAGISLALGKRSASFLARFFGSRVGAWFGGLGLDGASGRFVLGAISGLLPCGPVYLAAVQGAATGNVGKSLIVMGTFALGTTPALFVVALGGRAAFAALGPRALKFAGAVLLLAMGGLALWRALAPILAPEKPASCCH